MPLLPVCNFFRRSEHGNMLKIAKDPSGSGIRGPGIQSGSGRFLRTLLTKLTKLTGMFWRDSGAIHCSIYKRCIAATIARIWIPNLGHLRSVDMSVSYLHRSSQSPVSGSAVDAKCALRPAGAVADPVPRSDSTRRAARSVAHCTGASH